MTNKSEDDLVYKEEVPKINLHREQKFVKSSMKPFDLKLDEVTGVNNIL